MMTLFPTIFLVGWFLILALVGGILLFAFKRRPQRSGWVGAGASTQPAWSGDRAPAPTSYTGEWNAEVKGGGGFGNRGRTFGLFRLDDGVLSFLSDGSAMPAWAVPCHQLAARRRGFFELDGADLRLVGPMGDLRCSVSLEHINRASANTMKDLRERQYAEDFVRVLQAHGAGVAP